MLTKLNDGQEVIMDLTNVHDFFKSQEQTDKWLTVYTNELETLPLEDNELNLHMEGAFCFESRNGFKVDGFAPDVEDDDIRTSMATTKTSILVPCDDKMQMYPIRYTAWNHVQERAGITGGSISSLKDRKRAVEMAPATRSEILNEGLKLYRDKTLVLIRDGKVTALLSGDESDYSVMPVIRLVKILESELTDAFSSFEMKEARTSHEVTSITYNLMDEKTEKRILQMLSSTGQLVSDVKIRVKLTTSDIGACSARLSPVIYIDGRQISIGKSLSTKHKGGNKAMSLFTDNAHMLLAHYRDNLQNLQHLMDVQIKNPASCLKRVYEFLKLKGFAAELVQCCERISQEHQFTCTGYDIYWYLNEVLFQAEENLKKDTNRKISLMTLLDAQETVSETLFLDLTQFDY